MVWSDDNASRDPLLLFLVVICTILLFRGSVLHLLLEKIKKRTVELEASDGSCSSPDNQPGQGHDVSLSTAEDDGGGNCSLPDDLPGDQGHEISLSSKEDSDGNSSLPGVQLGQEYEVFLNFRGEDTRTGFTDHLCHSLRNAGVHVFRDNEKLHVGEEIGPQLIKGIEQSRIFIPIFSKNYADSKWCLKEFALMMECRKTMNHVVLPIFYDVTPNEVQHQTGKFQEAFAEHVNKFDLTTVQQWRNALSEVGSLKGWEKEKMFNGHEAKLVELVVAEVRKMLNKGHVILKDTLVGLEEQVCAVMGLLEVGAPDVRIVGIWGMGGIGKTTLADIVYNLIVDQFDCCGILKDIREISSHHRGIEFLQSMLIAQLSKAERKDYDTVSDGIKELRFRFGGKKVLILLDDIDRKQQLDALGAAVEWFHGGSRIIITTRDRAVLDKSRDKIYAVEAMKHDQALQLFCKHAFKTYSPPAQLRELSEDIVKTTGGLPLALEIIGGLLAGKGREIWESTLEKLQKIPQTQREVELKLRLSYDALSEEQKYIFLDIACFYIGEDLTIASYIWKDHFNYSPTADIYALWSRSLIKITRGNKLWMHDQLRDLGRAVIQRENNDAAGRRIWLWRSDDAMDRLRHCKGLTKVEAICLDHHPELDRLKGKQCRELFNLKFMQLYGVELKGSFQQYLPNLRWFKGRDTSIKSITSLPLKNLVVLNLSRSRIGHDWIWSHKQVVAVNLKVLDLSWCDQLTRTPDFSLFPNLERLSIGYCIRLTVVDSSIGKLKHLVHLNLQNCWSLKELPHQMSALISLVELHMCDVVIKDIPLSGDMKKLQVLHASCHELRGIPNCIGGMTSLRVLALNKCYTITELPESTWQLTSLVELDLYNTKVSTLSESIGNLCNLERLSVRKTGIRCLPSGLGNLKKLKVLDASWCPPLEEEIPAGIWGLSYLEVLKVNAIRIGKVPAAVTSLSHLHTLHLDHSLFEERPEHSSPPYIIPRLETLPSLPVSLISAVVACKSIAPIPNLPHLTSLKELEFRSCVGMAEIPRDIAKFPNLQKLSIVGCVELRCIPTLPISLYELYVLNCPSLVAIQGLENLTSLKILRASECEKLQRLEGLERLEALNKLIIPSCAEISKLGNLSKLKSLTRLNVSKCKKLQDLEGLDGLEKLCELDIWLCETIERLPNLSNLKQLKRLDALGCEKLQDLEGLHGLEGLEYLRIQYCIAIERLPNLSNLKRLRILSADHCERLQNLEGLDGLEALEDLDIYGCRALEKLPNLSKLKRLNRFNW